MATELVFYPTVVEDTAVPALVRLRLDGNEFEANLDCIARSSLSLWLCETRFLCVALAGL